MRIGILVAGMVLIGLCGSAVAEPEFHPYESRTPLIKEGQGGERKTVDGIDIWLRGTPPKRYQVMGSLTDERYKNLNLYSLFSNKYNLDSQIAKATKAAGGDAAIVDAPPDGVTANADDLKMQSRYLIVKYLPDAPPVQPSTQPPTQ